MAEMNYEKTPLYNTDVCNEKTNTNITDLHAYFMTQFNIELEKKNKHDSFKFGTEESYDFNDFHNFNTEVNKDYELEIIDAVIENKNVSEENIKDVLLDLDCIEFEPKNTAEYTTENQYKNDYIDDESLIDELCREESDSSVTPDLFKAEYVNKNKNHALPPIETAFSKKYCNYKNEQTSPPNLQNLNTPIIENLDYYSYPNNILYNLDNENYILPDTPTSCSEFSYDRNERKTSVSESIESDVNSCYYDENAETFDEEDLFVNLDDFGFNFDEDYSNLKEDVSTTKAVNGEKEKSTGDKICLWEHCYEKYPNQSALVEHIERCHVNAYKGDEFSCLWRECARQRRPFNARYKLLIHMRVHSGHKPNRCHHPGCGKAFSRLENLKIHIRSHTGEKPYACPAPHCRKAFSNSSDRAKHQRTHFNARPYACGAVGCGKRYTDPSSLRKHVKSHPHVENIPRTYIPPPKPMRRIDHEQLVPSSPAKLATLRCIRDKLTVPKLHRLC